MPKATNYLLGSAPLIDYLLNTAGGIPVYTAYATPWKVTAVHRGSYLVFGIGDVAHKLQVDGVDQTPTSGTLLSQIWYIKTNRERQVFQLLAQTGSLTTATLAVLRVG